MLIANENELLALVQRVLPSVHRALVLAPHPDDEVFGCGGTLCLLRDSGVVVDLVVVTDGAQGGENAEGRLAKVREEESRAAAHLLGLSPPIFWREPDRGLVYGEFLITRFMEIISDVDAELIFLPSPTELHPDHQAVAFAGAEAIRRLGVPRQAVFYELNAPLAVPNLILDISRVAEQKRRAMSCFQSQLVEQPYDERITGLNRYRAFYLGSQVDCAEAFYLAEAGELGETLPLLLAGAPLYRRRWGFAQHGMDLPLVSIIVRSMDRPTLTDTLDSLALQTYPNLEVIVVNAKGVGHQELAKCCGCFPMRVVARQGEFLGRSAAANAGLDAAVGRYIGFLDDDDTIDPDHIQHLVKALEATGDDVVVYAGVRGLSREEPGTLLTQFAHAEVSFAKLLLDNVIPIHAPLFSASLLKKGVRFDESLALYEDWDFWLQLARLVPFRFSGRITATYFSGGDSGVGISGTDTTLMTQAKLALFAKWLKLLRPEEWLAFTELYHAGQRKQHAELEELHRQRAEQDHQLATLYSSRSLRFTAPLRWLGRMVRRCWCGG